MSLSNIAGHTRRAVLILTLGLVLLLSSAFAVPATAQISLGSPNDPPRVAFGGGAFDFTPDSSHKDSKTAVEFRGEYRFGDVLWFLAPFVGGSLTSDGATYGYFGFGFDVNFGPNWVLTPTGAAGVFEHGWGTKLGSWWEFRTGAELAYRFDNQTRLGLAVTHTSNAGLTRLNPGEQSIVVMYSIPVR